VGFRFSDKIMLKYEIDSAARQNPWAAMAGANQDRWSQRSSELCSAWYRRYRVKNLNANDNVALNEVRLAA